MRDVTSLEKSMLQSRSNLPQLSSPPSSKLANQLKGSHQLYSCTELKEKKRRYGCLSILSPGALVNIHSKLMMLYLAIQDQRTLE